MRKGSFLLAVWSKGMDGWSGSPDWKHVDGGKVGMFSVGVQISVRSFKVRRL
jgi:hypothetical protein